MILPHLLLAALALQTHPEAGSYEWPRSAEYMSERAVLVFSETKGWRHEAGIPAATLFFNRLGAEEGFSVHSTEDSQVFTAENLARFEAVVLNSVTGDVLTDAEEKALQDWLEAGGGLIALHGAGDGSQESWPWYRQNVIGAAFSGHPIGPQFQDAEVQTLSDHPVTEGLPKTFIHNDEWYSFAAPPGDDFIPLIGVVEGSYKQVAGGVWPDEDLVMGPDAKDHPVAWTRCIGKGRTVFSALGHQPDAYEAEEHKRLLKNALGWVTAKEESGGCEAR